MDFGTAIMNTVNIEENNIMNGHSKYIKSVIVDDEREGIHALQYMLGRHCPQVKVLETFQSSVEALKQVRRLKPDLLFLDIKMPNISGLELLDILGTQEYHAIFVTAFDEYMLQALRLNALDYLKKPVNETELKDAVKRVELSEKVNPTQIKKALEHVEQGFEINQHTPFGIKEGNKIRFVKIDDIAYCKSDGNFTHVFLKDGDNIFSSYSLGTMEEKLPEKYFFRSHREYLINGYSISEYDKAEGGSITMRGNHTVPISRGRREDFQQFIQTFL